MKGKIAALIVGLMLGISTTAVAASSIYWNRGGNDYNCQGTENGVICNSGGYSVGVTRDYVFVQKRSYGKPTFGCRKYTSWQNCVSD